jgi:hypothetical protein
MKIIPLVTLLLLLGACAKPLQPDNYPEQISSTRLDYDTFEISSPGNRNSVDKKTIDLALLRSAEVALANGFNYFVIVRRDKSDASALKVGGQDEIELENTDHDPTLYRGKRYVHADPDATNTIVCFREKPEGFAYVALFVKASLRSKYRLDQVAE